MEAKKQIWGVGENMGTEESKKIWEENAQFWDNAIIEIFKGAAPYVICNVIVLISISLWGPLTTALPQLLGYSIF